MDEKGLHTISRPLSFVELHVSKRYSSVDKLESIQRKCHIVIVLFIIVQDKGTYVEYTRDLCRYQQHAPNASCTRG